MTIATGYSIVITIIASMTTLDALTRKHTAFGSFAELANLETDYRPSLYCQCGSARTRAELTTLANAYDRAMAEAGSMKRAFRGSTELAA